MSEAGEGQGGLQPIVTLEELAVAEGLLRECQESDETEPERDFVRDWAPRLLATLHAILEAGTGLATGNVFAAPEDAPPREERPDDAGQLMTRTEALVYVQHLMATEYLRGELVPAFVARKRDKAAPVRDRKDAGLCAEVTNDIARALERANSIALLASQKVQPAGAIIHVPGTRLPGVR